MNEILQKEVEFKEEVEKKNEELEKLNNTYRNEKERIKETLTEDLESKSVELSDYREKIASTEKQLRMIQDELK